MSLKLIILSALLVFLGCFVTSNVFAQSNSKGANSPIVVGKLIGFDESGKTLVIQTKDAKREFKSHR